MHELWSCYINKTTNMSMEDCGNETCERKIGPRAKAVQCEICDDWWHIDCAKMKEEEYNVISKTTSGLHWFCNYCNRGSAKLLQKIGKMQKELDEQKEEVAKLKSEVVECKFNQDRQEQYSRKDNIRISGLPDPKTADEDTNAKVIKVALDMGIVLKDEDISVSHRLGKLTATYDRPVIVKLTRRDTKRKLRKNKPDYLKILLLVNSNVQN